MSKGNYRMFTNHVNCESFGLKVALDSKKRLENVTHVIYPDVPITKEGVMNGGYKPPEEVEKFAQLINDNNIQLFVSEQHPDNGHGFIMASEEVVGMFNNARYDPVTTQVLADVHINKVHGDIINKIDTGVYTDVSIGYFADVQEVEVPGEFNDTIAGKIKVFDSIEREMFPNHLAILGEQEGACSVSDGCGFGAVANNGVARQDCGCSMGAVATAPKNETPIPGNDSYYNWDGTYKVTYTSSNTDTNITGVNPVENDTETETEENTETETTTEVIVNAKYCLACGTTYSGVACPTCGTKDYFEVPVPTDASPTTVDGDADTMVWLSTISPEGVNLNTEVDTNETGEIEMTEENETEFDVNALSEEELKDNEYVKNLVTKVAESDAKFAEIEQAELTTLREKVNARITEEKSKELNVNEMNKEQLELVLNIAPEPTSAPPATQTTHIKGDSVTDSNVEEVDPVIERNTKLLKGDA